MEQSSKIRERLIRILMAGVLGIAIAMIGLVPSAALADDADSTSDLQSGIISTQADSSLPTSYNADIGKLANVTPIRLQNPWNSCWAFAVTGAMESSLLSTKQVTDSSANFLSPRHLAYFAFTMHGQGSQSEEGVTVKEGTNVFNTGGTDSAAIATMAAGWGPALESAYPYKGAKGLIEYATDASGNVDTDKPLNYSSEDDWTIDASKVTDVAGYQLLRAYTVGSTAKFSNPNDKKNSEYSLNSAAVEQTKDLVMQYGGATVSYLSDHSSVSEDEADDRNEFNKEYAARNHSVVIVGWNDSYSKSNFTEKGTPEGDGAWLCKNSWGSNELGFPNHNDQAGFDGYFWLSYYDRTITNITVYELTSASSPDTTTFIDQYDYLGRRSDMEDLTSNYNGQVWYANMFTAQQDQTVTHVSLELYKNNTTSGIDVYKLYDDAKNPEDGVLVSSQTVETPIAGYYKVKLDTPLALKAGERYSIVENVKADETSYDIPIEAAAVSGSPNKYTQHAVVNAGESWVCIGRDAGWTDLTNEKADIEKQLNSAGTGQWEIGNVMVKGYATAYDEQYAVNAETRVMYRLYNPYSGEHVFTANATERDECVNAGWVYENEAWIAPVESAVPVYRLYNSYEPLGDHHYTTSKEEYDKLVKEGWTGEDVGWYSANESDIGLYRLYNPNAYSSGMSGAHHYTSDKAESDNLVSLGWTAEGTAWYGISRP